jgi:DNA processing protein
MNTELLLTLCYLTEGKPKIVDRLVAQLPEINTGSDDMAEKIAAAFDALGRRFPTRRDIDTAHRQSLQSLNLAATSEITVIHRWQQHYPARLSKIPTAPPLLFVKGDPAGLSRPRAITIVGTRNPTAYGSARCAAVSERFTAHGFVVVSGLALGCDTVAHRACLRAGGRTAAVLAHGLLQVYPTANRRLADAILDRGGCLVSEHPPEIKPQAAYFVRRNRIQAALGDGVVVVESGRRGGTMHTAAACRQQGKPLFCLQHPEKYRHHLQVRGNRQLLAAAGALPLTGPGAVESAVEHLLGRTG